MSNRLAVIVCRGPTCGDQRNSGDLYRRLKAALQDPDLQDRIHLDQETCFGECQRGPNVLVCPAEGGVLAGGASLGLTQPGAVVYTRVTPEDLGRIIDRHLHEGKVVTEFLARPPVRDA